MHCSAIRPIICLVKSPVIWPVSSKSAAKDACEMWSPYERALATSMCTAGSDSGVGISTSSESEWNAEYRTCSWRMSNFLISGSSDSTPNSSSGKQRTYALKWLSKSCFNPSSSVCFPSFLAQCSRRQTLARKIQTRNCASVRPFAPCPFITPNASASLLGAAASSNFSSRLTSCSCALWNSSSTAARLKKAQGHLNLVSRYMRRMPSRGTRAIDCCQGLTLYRAKRSATT
mmetsp:Transcript_37428/g.86351  ORF Transcript_37428/g.86351 Transcript_37428/m.86351 type:complete len:231 (+) Transcript_37428:394-1086(+)